MPVQFQLVEFSKAPYPAKHPPDNQRVTDREPSGNVTTSFGAESGAAAVLVRSYALVCGGVGVRRCFLWGYLALVLGQ